ncbi:MAG TPA: adenylate/guanylate cyclase domain-containing protein [Gemmataceae bacterium]|jgi:adenylate cyclase
MAELEARFDTDPALGWRKPLPVAAPFVLGRHPGDGDWQTEWDNFISRQHATLTWDGARLHVLRRPSAGNPIFYNGAPADDFALTHGESFRIGNTIFTLHDEAAPIEVAATAKELSKVRFENADQRVEALAALPDLIRQSQDEAALERQVVDALLRGLPTATAAAVVRLPPEGAGPLGVIVTASARRGGNPEEVRPSRKLVHDAIRRRLSTSHVWGRDARQGGGDSKFSLAEFSLTDPGTDWAMCTPVLDEASAGYGLYVSGRLPRDLKTPDSVSKDAELRADLKFARLTADIFGALRQVHDLQRRQALLLRFLSPRVVRVVVNEPNKSVEEVLEAKPTPVTVLFCDLRGSCRIVEEGQTDLGQAWEGVSQALGIMTDAIVQFDGVVGDFQGDAAMGFWGWPSTAADRDDQIEQCCRAALTIRRHFASATAKRSSPLAGFACGLGLASGLAMAGRLGTMDQFKVGVFGPVVNLAARLESLTKQFRVPILVDDGVAKHVLAQRAAGWARVRRVAKVRPVGMQAAVAVSELLPPVGSDSLPESKRLDYESAVAAFEAGRWKDTRDLLKFLAGDGPSEFLVEFMNRHPGGPPDGWDGVIGLEKK